MKSTSWKSEEYLEESLANQAIGPRPSHRKLTDDEMSSSQWEFSQRVKMAIRMTTHGEHLS